MKRFLLVTAILVTFIGTAWGIDAHLPKDDNNPKESIQVMAPPATSPIITIAGAGNVTVSDFTVIMFDEDVTIYWGSDTTHTYDLPANTPIGVSSGVTTIHVSAGCSMLTM